MRKILGAVLLCAVFGLSLHFWLNIKEKHEMEELERTMSGAKRALQFMTSARAYPGDVIPATGIAKAFDVQKARRRLRLNKTTRVELKPWRAIGPKNIGGRTLALAINPQNSKTIYAGSASGGLWRSYTSGIGAEAWEYVATGFPVLGVSSIVIAPDDSNTIYIGTGEVYGHPNTQPGVLGDRISRGSYGIGILKSSDGGATWQKSLDWLYNQQRGVQMLKINPERSATVWAATTEGTYKSTDAGSTWQQVHDVVMATDIAVSPNDTSTVFVACGGMGSEGRGIYRTQDSGASWERLPVPGTNDFRGKIRLAMSPSVPNIIYASIGVSSGSLFSGEATGTRLVRSADGGATWSTMSLTDYSRIQGWYAHDVAVHPINPNWIWVAGQSNPYRSTDGGATLNFVHDVGYFIPHPETLELGLPESWADYHAIVFDPSDPDIVYFTNDGGVFRSDDGGVTIRNCNRGYQTTQFYNGVSSSDSDSLFTIGGMQDNNSAAYEGETGWRRMFGGDGAWTAINQDNNDIIYLSYQFLSLGRSTDRGYSIDFIFPPTNQSRTNFIAPYVLSPVDNQTLYAGGEIIYSTRNGGLSWTALNEGQPLGEDPMIAMAASYQDTFFLYAATSPGVERARIFRATGDRWVDVTGNLPDRFLTDIVLERRRDHSVYVTFGGFGTSHLFYSNDGGESWQDVGAGLPDVPVWSVAIDPEYPQQLFAGNDLGVYYSPDAGVTWQPHMEGLPDAIIAMDLSISISNRVLRVATHGNGFYESRLPTPEATSVEEPQPQLPEQIVLAQNFPNPFNLETTIRFYLPAATEADLVIYNSLGRAVRTLAGGGHAPGWHNWTWDGKDDRGKFIASGVYLCQLKTEKDVKVRKMIAVK